MEDARVLMNQPFDKPKSFVKLFDGAHQRMLIELVKQIKDNAVNVS